ncbi:MULTISPECIES: SRPBCC family protein [Alicyclobacillus]|uniref:SRPBCC family protein n=1 Tax=Alicyclobacillus TaxID=29330 RepID=UPI000835B345|nr:MULTISPECIES: SRPBCC domain-containing protein [Alicyclobacillus]
MPDSKISDIRKTVLLNAPIDKVWKAVATAEGIAAWFMPSDFQPVVGHEFMLDAGPWGKSPCKVTEVNPPHRIGFNWGKDWHVLFELKDLNGKTELTLVHSGWDAEKVTEFGESHTVVRDRMDGGWNRLVFESLRGYVEK